MAVSKAPSRYLTKSAFKIGRSCPTKLFYYYSEYPSSESDNEYLKFLADGGYLVAKIAQLLYPDGIMIDSRGGVDEAVRQTEEELKKDNVVLFEAALRLENKLVFVDILEKTGKTIKLIEVKSKSFDSTGARKSKKGGTGNCFISTRNNIVTEWEPYLADVCYQILVGRLAHPEFDFVPYLFLPDKSKTTSVDCLASKFKVIETSLPSSNKKYFEVVFSGDVEALRASHFMTLVNIEKEIRILEKSVESDAELLDGSLTPKFYKIPPKISSICSKCEYKVSGQPSGFNECWGELANVTPHIFDVYWGGKFLDPLIAEGKVSLFDVPKSELGGVRGRRRERQICYTKLKREWFSDDLKSKIEGVKYPLHFIDFETSRVAVPYHAGMRPFEQVAFQWSCHTVERPGAEPVHAEWINTEDQFPNFKFAEALRLQLGYVGTVLTWARHENSVLSDIFKQQERNRAGSKELAEWLERLVDSEEGRILDLNDVTFASYFHPEMKGQTSLKAVLPAVWNNNPKLHKIPWFKEYVGHDVEGRVMNPYKVLPKIDIAGVSEVVNVGTAAMLAYQEMLYGRYKDDAETKAKWKHLLLQYCKLDTLAMLVVWTHWELALGIRQG